MTNNNLNEEQKEQINDRGKELMDLCRKELDYNEEYALRLAVASAESLDLQIQVTELNDSVKEYLEEFNLDIDLAMEAACFKIALTEYNAAHSDAS